MELLNILGKFFNIFSIVILTFGIFITLTVKNHNNRNWLLAYLTCLLTMESLVIFIGVYLKDNMFFIFILSFFIQFSFLTYFYCSAVFQLSFTKRNTILCLGLLPFLIYALPEPYGSFLQYYGRAPYSFSIMLYSLVYFYTLINGSIATIHSRNLLNGTVLLFFTLDLFLALGVKYLITENLLQLNAWFWFIRAVFIEFFYIALIYYGWKSSKPQVELSKTS